MAHQICDFAAFSLLPKKRLMRRCCLIQAAQWRGPQDIKNRYPTASFLAEHRVIFNIKGNTYRLVVKARYRYGVVLIEWIGTHAEYDKQDFQ